jgi:hypothetical protein
MNYQEGRIKHLEATLAMTSSGANMTQRAKVPAQTFTPDSTTGMADRPAQVSEREAPLLHGRSFKTQYRGSSHVGALIGRLSELTSFSREAFERFPALMKAREDLSALKYRTEHADFKHTGANDTDLLELLPSQRDCDALVRTYFENFGCLYQVLHPPAFWKEFDGLWSEDAITRPHFVGLVLCLTACARCLRSSQPWLYIANSSVAREQSIAVICAVETWLRRQSQKNVSAEDFQIRFLLLLAKEVAAYKSKRTWTEAGELVRYCMAAGLHRDPDMIWKPTSVLEKELRKRIWAAVTEFELQAAFDKGMPSTAWILQSDCPPPSHIWDHDWPKDPEQMPTVRPLSQFGSAAFLAMAADSITLRTTINAALSNIRQTISFEDVRRYTDEIEHLLKSIPKWAGRDGETSRAMLTLNLRQYLLTIHERQVQQTLSKSERDYSRMVIIETATLIIDTHRSLTAQGCFTLETLRADHQRAALALCSIKAAIDPVVDGALSVLVNEVIARNVPEVLTMLTERVYRYGCDQRQLWMLSALHGYAQAKHDPAKRLEYMQDTVDRVLRTYYKIMACQDETAIKTSRPDRTRRSPPEAMTSVIDSGLQAPVPHAAQIAQQEIPTSDFDIENLIGWTFDDFSFMPDNFANGPAYTAPFFEQMAGT